MSGANTLGMGYNHFHGQPRSPASLGITGFVDFADIFVSDFTDKNG